MNAFEELHPALRYHIVNTLGWRDLRATQRSAIAPIQAGKDALLLAPTAGGKTEAAFFPLISLAATQDWRGLSILYVCPLKALLNNLEPRLNRYASFVGRRVGLWHGDIKGVTRRRIVKELPDILLTTPESLEAILVSANLDHKVMFGHVRAVIVDELHSFASDDRGWHLLAILARIERLSGRRLQRIGLSATVGNPAYLLDWLTRNRGGDIIRFGEATSAPDVVVDYVGSIENAVKVLSHLHRGERRLIFADSRARVEALASGLRHAGVRTFVSHASLSADARKQAEAAFAAEPDCAIVATSTLELGIDVGDLDRVVQVGAPPSVGSFLQRMGRSGRRPGTKRNLLFLATTESELLLALGIVRLWGEGFVEHIEPPTLPAHIYGQQIMALTLQERGITVDELPNWLGDTFLSLDDTLRNQIIQYMFMTNLLIVDGGVIGLGERAEREFGRKHFSELLVSFSAPMLLSVYHGRVELGTVHPLAVASTPDGRPVVVLLGGRSWRVVDIDWPRRRISVVPAAGEGLARWIGSARPASFAVCRATEAVVAGNLPGCELSRRATSKLDQIRGNLHFVDCINLPIVGNDSIDTCIWTFSGGRANSVIASLFGPTARFDDFYIRIPKIGPESASLELKRSESVSVPARLCEELIDGLKFSSCLPREISTSTIESRMLDQNEIRYVFDKIHKIIYDIY